MKTIKGSSRGITFTSEQADIGTKYRYVIDMNECTVNIVDDINAEYEKNKEYYLKNCQGGIY